MRKRDLAISDVLIGAREVAQRIRVRVEDGALGTSNTLRNLHLIRDGFTKGHVPRLTQCRAISVGDEPEHHNTLPRLCRVRKSTLRRATEGKVVESGYDAYSEQRMWPNRVHVPLARGRLIPEMASMREDFPAL